MDVKAKEKLIALWNVSSLARTRFQKMGIVLVSVLWIGLCCPLCCRDPTTLPPQNLHEEDLVGIWLGTYQGIQDRLNLRADGTFIQSTEYVWLGTRFDGYKYETTWNTWRIERQSDGNIWLHLDGAQFFPDGITWAESDESNGHGYYNPYGEGFVYMKDELILSIRTDRTGETILAHMCSYRDSCNRYKMRRIG